MSEYPSSFLTPLARGELDPNSGERRVVAISDVPAGHPVAVFGGIAVTREQLIDPEGIGALGLSLPRVTLQVDEDMFLVSTRDGPGDWINHSCEPNAGLRGQVVLVALRWIDAGEEITFDYATSDGSEYDEFTCRCGSPSCRGRISGQDWRIPALWARYAGHFSPYLARRIETLRASQVVTLGGRMAKTYSAGGSR